MKKKCDHCGYVHDMILSEEKGNYNPIFGSICTYCGAFIEPIDDLSIIKMNKEKFNRLKKRCLEQAFGAEENKNAYKRR